MNCRIIRAISVSKLYVFVVVIIGSGSMVWAQESVSKDTIPKSLKPYPILRKYGVSFNYTANTNYTTDFKEIPSESGEVQRNNIYAYGTFNILNKKKLTISLTEYVINTKFEFKNDDPQLFDYEGTSYNFYNFNTSLNLTYRTLWLKKPFIGNLSVVGSTQDFMSINKVSGMVSGMFVFQKNENTRYTLGLVGILDPSAEIPVFPLVTYWHRFRNPLYEVSVILPKELKVRRAETLGGWVSLGSEFSSFSHFIPGLMNQTGMFENRFSEIKFGLGYDKPISKRTMFSVNMGYAQVVENNLTRVYKTPKHRMGEVTYDGAFYLECGISYLFK